MMAVLLAIALLLAGALTLVTAYAMTGSLEMFPTSEREEGVFIAMLAMGAPILLLEIVVVRRLRRRWLRARGGA